MEDKFISNFSNQQDVGFTHINKIAHEVHQKNISEIIKLTSEHKVLSENCYRQLLTIMIKQCKSYKKDEFRQLYHLSHHLYYPCIFALPLYSLSCSFSSDALSHFSPASLSISSELCSCCLLSSFQRWCPVLAIS